MILVSKLENPYPPKYHWIVESKNIDDQWRKHIETSPQPDKREKRHPIYHLDRTKLQADAGPDRDAIFRDKESNELVMVVIRNFTKHPGLLEYMDDIIKANTEYRKSVRVYIYFNLFQF